MTELPEAPAELHVREDLHGAHLQVPVDRESFPKWLAVFGAVAAFAVAWPQALMLLLVVLVLVVLVLPDRRRTLVTLDGDALTLQRTHLGVPTPTRVLLVDIREVLAPSDPPRLVVRTSHGEERIEWAGSAAGLGWLAAAIRLQVERARQADPIPPVPAALRELRGVTSSTRS